MIIVFTKSDTFWAKALIYFCDEPLSHVAFILPEVDDYIIHSSNHGVEKVLARRFFRKNNVVKAIKIESFQVTEKYFDSIISNIIEPYLFKPYDWPAYIWLGLLLILRKYTGIKLPKKNIFSTDRGFLCCEVFAPLTRVLLQHSSLCIDIDLAITTPFELWRYLTQRKSEYVSTLDDTEIKAIISKYL